MSFNSKLFDLSGKTALITGSSRGMGFALARGLAQHGAKIVLNGQDAQRLDRAVKSLQAEELDVEGQKFDVSDEPSVQKAVAEIEERNPGGIEILINNAGIQRRHPFLAFPLEVFNQVVEVNLVSAFIVARAVAQYMARRKSGRIINILSLNAELARSSISAYSAAKGGMRMLTRSMALELAPMNIRTNGIGPGYFDTEMTEALVKDSDFDTWLRGRVPQGRWGKPEDLVGAAVFLASDASAYVNGQVLYVDGGMMITL
jgi:gluconate 5-dehydrogenase